jgi:hypothetical protein
MYNSISVMAFHFSWKMQSMFWTSNTPDDAVFRGPFAGEALREYEKLINSWICVTS